MVGNPETATLIAWSEEGRSFWIHDPDALEAMVLPRVFKHNRIAFFTKQARCPHTHPRTLRRASGPPLNPHLIGAAQELWFQAADGPVHPLGG
jgi:hypothetical protein